LYPSKAPSSFALTPDELVLRSPKLIAFEFVEEESSRGKSAVVSLF
jgi:hypothetical protein